jgi:hypothetical protein
MTDRIQSLAWEYILNFVSCDGSCDFTLTADQIKEAGKANKTLKCQFEPRLLCKQDTFEDRPEILKKLGLFIIAVENGTYKLIKQNIYQNLEYPNTLSLEIERNNTSAVLNIGNSETSVIDNLRYSGLFESEEYLNEKILYGPLLNGRHRCTFETQIGENIYQIRGVQYETDSCYESQNKVLLIEGKSGQPSSFNIRQLYFPYRSIYDAIKGSKEIIPLFISKDKKDIIHIWKYTFENPLVMTSIKLISYFRYKFN